MRLDTTLNIWHLKQFKLLRSTKQAISRDRNRENVSHLEIKEIVYSDLFNNYYQASTVLFAFVSDRVFEQLVNILPYGLISLNISNVDFFVSDLFSGSK